MRRTTWLIAAGAALVLVAAGVATANFWDFGQHTQRELAHHANQLFGVKKPIDASSTVDLTEAEALADPAALVTVAKGLKVSVVSAGNAAPNLDQMVLWPQSHPTHIITINEEGPTEPSLQKIDLKTGVATTIVSGTDSGDPIRITPWGTILFGEEAGDTGAMYELIDPLSVEGATINRTTGANSTRDPVGQRAGYQPVRGPRDPAERRHLLRQRAGGNRRGTRRRVLQVRPDHAVGRWTPNHVARPVPVRERLNLRPACGNERQQRPGIPVRARLMAADRRKRCRSKAAGSGGQGHRVLPP